MANARVTGIAVDCPDPKALCAFYSTLLEIEPIVEDAVIIAKDDQGSLEMWFQPVENYAVPTWPTQQRGNSCIWILTATIARQRLPGPLSLAPGKLMRPNGSR